jgi:putative colanic acid biosynthesis acetyltransferase WcaB
VNSLSALASIDVVPGRIVAQSTDAVSSLNNFGELVRYWRSDLLANPRDPKACVLLFGFRWCQALRTLPCGNMISLPFVAAYRIFSEWILGVELRPKTQVGPGLSIYHGVGLVVNDHSVIGSGVKLRHGVTIGHARAGGLSPVIGDRVNIGAGAIILGEISIGADAVIAAGSVVVRNVPQGATAFGNPAVLRLKE